MGMQSDGADTINHSCSCVTRRLGAALNIFLTGHPFRFSAHVAGLTSRNPPNAKITKAIGSVKHDEATSSLIDLGNLSNARHSVAYLIDKRYPEFFFFLSFRTTN